MPLFKIKAKNAQGDIYTTEREVADKFVLYKDLKANGEEIISINEIQKRHLSLGHLNFNFLSKGGVKMHERINFARNLGSMLEAGLSLSRALSVIERQAKNKRLANIVHTLIEDISQGKTLSDALKVWPNTFSQLFVSMVRAGEESGTLAASLRVVALQMDRVYTLQRRIRGAMMYPSVIIFAMVIIAILMLTYVVPSLMKTFSELKVELPASTKFILFVSESIQHHGLLVLLFVLAVAGGFYYFSKSTVGKKILDAFYLKIPLIGGIIKEVNTARTARTMSSLLNAGVDMVESVKITAEVLQNYYYKNILANASETIKKGEVLSKSFSTNPNYYPAFLGEMVGVGEETGKMGEMFLNVAAFYEDSVEQKTKDMSTIIEPFLMVIIAVAVGFFAIAMISPMYSLVDVI
ncbi:MAG: type II secretion system F family protein [Patescibacteria group bacterium]